MLCAQGTERPLTFFTRHDLKCNKVFFDGFAMAYRLENSRSDEGQLRFLAYTLEMGSRLADLKGAQLALACTAVAGSILLQEQRTVGSTAGD